MADYGHRESDRRLAEFERRIEKEYKQAYKEVKAKTDKFFEKFEKTDKEMSQKVKQGEINKSDYIEWRRKAMIRGNALKDLEKTLAQDLVQADRIATELISGHKVDIYALNRNYGEYEIENALSIDLGFSLYDHKSVEKLIKDQPALLPTQLDEARDLRWNRQKVSSAITQGILQGESIPNIGKRLQKVVGMDKTASIRNARTATTGAENAGRVDSYEDAEKKGVELEKKWVATLDQRTRSEHRQLDGQTCPIHDKFKVDGEEIGYPGDPTAAGYLVYGCRCTLVAEVKGIKYKDMRWDRLPEGMSYKEWKGEKEDKGERNALNAIKSAYPNSVISSFENGKVTFQFNDKPKAKQYTYNASNYQQLADRLKLRYGETPFEQSFFGETKTVSNQYFKMKQQVSNDGKMIAFATTNIKVINGSPALVVSNHDVIFLKDNQYQGIGIRNKDITTDAIMVKITESEFKNAKRYSYKADFAIDDTTFNDLKKIAKKQEKSGNSYKTYAIAIYRDRIETSVGKKGRKIV